MDTTKESVKLDQIIKEKRFSHRGVTYQLDLNSTTTHPGNKSLANVPMRRLVGTDDRGNIIVAWSHDCSVAEPVKVIPTNEVEEDIDDVPMVAEKPKKQAKAKPSAKKSKK